MSEDLRETLDGLVDLSRAAGKPNSVEGGVVQYAVIPQDAQVVSLAEFQYNEHQERPERKKGTARVLDAASFCEYYRLFQDADSRVFADETTSKILAVLDYHESGHGEDGPRWGQHRIDLTLRHSEEWKRWIALNGKRTPQMEFAEHLENNAPDIVDPDAATMLEVARDLSAKTDVDFGSAIRMANGSVQFKYSEQVKGTYGNGNIDIPERFVIAIPVYVGGERTQIVARLRYRIASGKLTFWYDLLRAGEAERNAFLEAREVIERTLELVIINGTPA